MRKRVFLIAIGTIAAGVLLARAQLFTGLRPFGMAALLACAASGKNRRPLLLGLIIGGLSIEFSLASALVHVLPYFLAGIGLELITKWKLRKWLYYLIAVICSLIPTLIMKMLLYDIIMLILQAAAAVILAGPAARGLGLLERGRGLAAKDEIMAAVLFGAAMLTGVQDVHIYGVSVMYMLFAFTIVLAARIEMNMSSGLGSLVGLLVLLRGGTVEEFACIAACALMAGLFREMGRFGPPVGLAVGNVMITLLTRRELDLIMPWPAMVISFAALAIPEHIIARLRGNGRESLREERAAKIAAYKLGHMADIFGSMAKAYNEASTPDNLKLADDVKQRVCAECDRTDYCWRMRKPDTLADIAHLQKAFLNNAPASDVAAAAPPRCKNKPRLIMAIADITQRKKIKPDPALMMMTDYCSNLERIVRDLSTQVNETGSDPEIERAIMEEADAEGLRIKELYVQNGARPRVTVMRRPCLDGLDCEKRVAPVLSKVCNTNMSCTLRGCDAGNCCVAEFEEASKYAAVLGAAQRSKDDETGCGDSYAYTHLADGRTVLALSDGMGSGEAAASESRAAVSLIEDFLSAGLDEHVCLDLANNLLMLRGREDTYSTADICIMDLAGGTADFLKIGACNGYILREGSIEPIESGALPMGIVEGVIPAVARTLLRPHDTILLISDGVFDAFDMDNKKLEYVLNGLRGKPPQELAEQLIAAAAEAAGGARDDMTALAVRIYEPAA